jgi:hypothetical protein
VRAKPPEGVLSRGARPRRACDANDAINAININTEKWEGKTMVDRPAAAACRPDEWLVVEAWDES